MEIKMKKIRKYYPEPFEITTWENLEKELQKLLDFEINSKDDLLEFWEKVSELVKILEDKVAWLYINMTRFSDKLEHKEALNEFMSTIVAKNEPFQFRLKKKFYESPFRQELPKEYDYLNKLVANEIELFREENVKLSVKEQDSISRYGEITSKMTVTLDGEEKTIQQLGPYLEKQNRAVRENAWRLMFERYAQDQNLLDELFDELKQLRGRIAKNAGFENYRDFAHQDKGRFSYTPDDLLKLHDAVEKVVVPFIEDLNRERAEKLKVENLRPWDFNVEISGETPRPFVDDKDLIAKGIKTIAAINPLFGIELEKMQANNFLDLENRKGKGPGGYCYPIYEHNSSFIFMHAVGVRRDVVTFVHEAGHAMHNMLSKRRPIFQYTNNPGETSELASMSMELLSFDYWNNFYAVDILKNLRRDELMEKIKFLPWGVVIDAFQHWIYTNPEHTPKERGEYFAELLDRFKIGGNWDGLEKEKAMRWMMQLHIFQFPFYYIEYVIAQLGAIGIYRNYKKDSKKTLEQYENFLKFGSSKSVAELYEVAGVPFDFSEKYIVELVEFLRSELKKDF